MDVSGGKYAQWVHDQPWSFIGPYRVLHQHPNGPLNGPYKADFKGPLVRKGHSMIKTEVFLGNG